MPESSAGGTSRRKGEHIDIVTGKNVSSATNYWDCVTLLHNSLPEVDFDEISTETEFMGRKIGAPIIISGMTGGFDRAMQINRNLAEAAEELRIPMGVGSQRAAIEDRALSKTYSVIAEYDIPLRIANLGAPQLIQQGKRRAYGIEEVREAMDMVKADLIAIHLNYLQEVVQPEGDRKAAHVLEKMKEISTQVPVMAKETGAGMSRQVALRLRDAGVRALDVGGLGGTSWSAVEHYRAERKGDETGSRLGSLYWNWGIPTPVSVLQCAIGIPLVATGGIRNGLDVARALSLGANCAGVAGAIIKAATQGKKEVRRELEQIVEEMKAAMFLTGSRNVRELAGKGIVLGEAKQWLDALQPGEHVSG